MRLLTRLYGIWHCVFGLKIAPNFNNQQQRISRFFSHPWKFSPRNSRHPTPIMQLVLAFRESFLREMLLSYQSATSKISCYTVLWELSWSLGYCTVKCLYHIWVDGKFFQWTFFRAFESFLFIMKMMLCMSLCGAHVYMYVCTHIFYDLLNRMGISITDLLYYRFRQGTCIVLSTTSIHRNLQIGDTQHTRTHT